MKKLLIILASIIICILVGFISSRFQVESLSTWYPTLNKSSLNPPNWVFPVAWTTLYVFMGISIGLIICKENIVKLHLVMLFVLQLLFNFLWSIIFFYLQSPTIALGVILVLIAVNIVYTCKAWKISTISSILFLPYILWLIFAAYLNSYIVWYN